MVMLMHATRTLKLSLTILTIKHDQETLRSKQDFKKHIFSTEEQLVFLVVSGMRSSYDIKQNAMLCKIDIHLCKEGKNI